MRPLARRDALLLRNVGDQLVVYDQKRQRLHVLSRSAALVWQHCDGDRDVAQLAELVGRELGTPATDELILSALQQLEAAELLSAGRQSALPAESVSRREMMSRALGGLAAGVLVPVVTSCGSIVDAMRPTARSTDLIVETTTNTTTLSTTPFSTTTTSPFTSTTTTPFTTTTSSTSTTPPISTTTSTTSTTPPITTTTSTTSPLTTTTTTTSPLTTTTTTTVATTTTPLPRKVQMCHNGKTIMVDRSAIQAHLAKGDTLGPCPR
jgi:hypothetical protein